MARIIDKNHVAIFYEKVTGRCQFDGTITTDETHDIDDELRRHPWLDVIIISRDQLPGLDAVQPTVGPPVTANEHFFRQTIADYTGTPYFERGADRAVMVHLAGHVVSIHLGNVPGRDNPHPGHALVSHRSADVGDVHDGEKFIRRYAVVHSETGNVVDVIHAPVDEPEDILPSAPDNHHVLPHRILNIGDKTKPVLAVELDS